MKKLYLVFLICLTAGYSQQKNNNVEINITGGQSNPSSGYSDDGFASKGNFFELSTSYYFSKLGVGLSLGQYSNPTKDNVSNLTSSLSFSTINNSEDWKTMYYGVGPEYKMSFNKIEAKFLTRLGIMSIEPMVIESSYTGSDTDIPIPYYSFTADETTSIAYFSTGIQFGYKISPSISAFINTSYLSSFSDGISVAIGNKNVQDVNKNGVIDAQDFIGSNGVALEFTHTQKDIKPQVLNYGVGITWHIGGSTNQKPDTPKRKTKETTSDVTINPTGHIAFTNPSKEKADEKKQQQKIITTSPKNNSNFRNESELNNFTWTIIGKKIVQPKYIVEISKLNNNRQNEWMLTAKTSTTKISLEELFKQNSFNKRVSERLRHKDRAVFTEGRYKWKVTELSTGITTTYSFFNFTNCEIDFSIANEEIECLGYEGADRKYKICFDVTYSSTSGDLTFLDPSSGLTVYDQTYATLTYTLVSPNPTLVIQVGATVSTVSYCFEVTVSSSVTSIGFGLQGDDLDPSPILCQPGVSASFDELPDCICDDCEEIELSFDDFNISLNGSSANQFNFSGNINVNVPIYAIEFQIQSYSYTATPPACTDGVTSVEESGMFLMPGTTINGSSTLELLNETISGSASSNDNATKAIKYTSTSSLTGAIPVNLTIGLPGPLLGLDPSCCCLIEYRVCIKVRIFYEDGNCKSCVFTHCFEFNNQ